MSVYHYPAAASAAEGWGHCSWYITANANKPDVPTEDSLAGEAAHWVGSECLKMWRDPTLRNGAPMCVEWLNRKSPEGVVIDHNMVEGAQVFVDECLKIAQKHGALQDMLIEHPVKMDRIHELNGGTLDFALVRPGLGRLYVIDYKHGHRENRAKGNFQLIDYAEGLVEQFPEMLGKDEHVKVSLGIVQPFCYNAVGPLDLWEIHLSDLRPYFNTLHNQAHAAFTAPTQSSGLWCRDCAAVMTCDTRKKATYNLIDYVNVPPEIDSMGSRDLAIERSILDDGIKATQSRLDALNAELEHRIRNGDVGSGLSLAQGRRGNNNWTVEAPVAIALGHQFGVDAKVPDKAITATQLRALISPDKRDLFDLVTEKFAERKPGKLQLIATDDTIGARAFKKEF